MFGINTHNLTENGYDTSKIIYAEDIIYSRLTPKNMINYIDFLHSHHKYSWEKLLKTFPEYISTNKIIN